MIGQPDPVINGSCKLRPVATFFGAPIGELETLGPHTIAIAGLYCDHYCGGEPGARFAARQLRYTSRPDCSNPAHAAFDKGVFDIGDLNVFPLQAQKTRAALAQQCERVLRTGARLLCLGGDYSLAPALLAGALAAMPSLSVGVIRISRRLDLADLPSFGADTLWRPAATSQIAELLPGGLEHIAILGVCGAAAAEEVHRAKPAMIIRASELANSLETTVGRFHKTLPERVDAWYLSVDADVLCARYTPTPTIGRGTGLEPAHVRTLIRALQGIPFMAAEVVGHLPEFDIPGRSATALLAGIARATLDLLGHCAPPCR